MLLVVIHICVCMHTSHLHLVFFSGIPINCAFNFTFKMSWEPRWVKSHLNILMGIWFKITIHWLELQIVTTHETRFKEFKFQFLGFAQVVKDDKSIRSLSSFELSKIDCLIRECCLLPFISKVSSAVWEIFIEINFLWHFSHEFWVITLASDFENMLIWARSLNVADFNW